MIALGVYKALFGGEEGFFNSRTGKRHRICTTSRSGLRYCDVGKFRYIEQNPHKRSKWAERARKGEKIMWVIYRPGWIYAGVVVNGHPINFAEGERYEEKTAP